MTRVCFPTTTMDTTSLSLRLSTLAHLVGTSTEASVLPRLRTIAAGLDDVPDASLRFLLQHWPEYDAHLQPLPPAHPDAQHAVHALQLHDELATAYREISDIAALQGALDAKANKALASKSPPSHFLTQAEALADDDVHTESMDASRLHMAKQREEEQDERAKSTHQRVLDLVTNWANYVRPPHTHPQQAKDDRLTGHDMQTTSVSHAFVLLDTQLATLERQLARLERERC